MEQDQHRVRRAGRHRPSPSDLRGTAFAHLDVRWLVGEARQGAELVGVGQTIYPAAVAPTSTTSTPTPRRWSSSCRATAGIVSATGSTTSPRRRRVRAPQHRALGLLHERRGHGDHLGARRRPVTRARRGTSRSPNCRRERDRSRRGPAERRRRHVGESLADDRPSRCRRSGRSSTSDADDADRRCARRATLSRGRRDRGDRCTGCPVAVKELFDVAAADGSYGSSVLAGRRGPSRRRGRRVAAQRRRRRRRHARVPRVRLGHHDPARDARLDTQPVAPRPDPRRVERGVGRRRRRRDGAAGGRQRHRRVDPHPGVVLRRVRVEDDPGRISRTGGVALAPTFDTVGFLARRARHCWQPPSRRRPERTGSIRRRSSARARRARFPRRIAAARFAVADVGPPVAPITAHVKALEAIAAALAELGIGQVDVVGAVGIIDVRRSSSRCRWPRRTTSITPSSTPIRSRPTSYGPDVRRRLEMAAEITIDDYLDARRLAAECGRATWKHSTSPIWSSRWSARRRRARSTDPERGRRRRSFDSAPRRRNAVHRPAERVRPAVDHRAGRVRRRRAAGRRADRRTTVERAAAARRRRGVARRRRLPGRHPAQFDEKA